jgi:SsrA-binding protein
MKGNVNIVNRKVKFEYHFIETFIVGLQLQGSEVKAISNSMISMVDTYCYFKSGELYVKGMNVTSNNVAYSHEPSRERKILMKKKELRKLEKELINGLTIIPYRVFRNERGLIKMEIVLAKGKNLYDKRNSLKEKDINREMMRGL